MSKLREISHLLWPLIENTFAMSVACKQTLFYFSFRSFQKHQRARERSKRARTSAEREKEKERTSPTTTPLRWRSINPPAVYILSPALDGLWRENRGSVSRLPCLANCCCLFTEKIFHLTLSSQTMHAMKFVLKSDTLKLPIPILEKKTN